MKYLLLSLLLATTNLQAQNTDFAPVWARWTYSEQNFALKIVPYVLESVEKVNYEGKWCSRLKPVGLSDVFSFYISTENDTVYYYSNYTNQFEMLYDFTAEVGDKWVIGGLPATIPDHPLPYASDTITVDSISSLYLGGDTLKVWHISNSFWFDWGDRIIEKVGNNQLFEPQFGLVEKYIWGLRCFENSEESYQFVSYPCDSIWSTINTTQVPLETLNIQVSPNPFQEKIQITVQPLEDTHRFLLYNQLGVLIFHNDFETSFELETSTLPQGIYYWTVEREGRHIHRGACLKME
ncbi:MAG: T9SS type A sorting domain-containing protein [Chitinophagales bacterium]|nr:T9SS type A sorting domain-containing protein [Chitinophagales bacterium]